LLRLVLLILENASGRMLIEVHAYLLPEDLEKSWNVDKVKETCENFQNSEKTLEAVILRMCVKLHFRHYVIKLP